MTVIFFIWILIIAITCFLLFFHIDGMGKRLGTLEDIVIETTEKCVIANDKLEKIDTSQDICCYSSGVLSGAYYISKDGLGMSVTSESKYYLTVCKEFCSLGYTENSDGTVTCIGNDVAGTTKLQECILKLKPVDCTSPSLPVASLGSIPYYAYHIETPSGITECTLGSCPN